MMNCLRNVYCCIDVEASGPVPGLHDLVSIGGVVVNRRADGTHAAADAPTFYVELQPQGGAIEPQAMAIHGLTTEHLRSNGVPMVDAMKQLSKWAAGAKRADRDRLVFVGHNAPFDWAYVNWAYHVARVPNPFGWKALDTKALAMGVLGLDWFDTNKEMLEKLLPGLGRQDSSRVHHADYDALYQAKILCGLLDHPGRATR